MQHQPLLDGIGVFVCREMRVSVVDLASTRREDIPARALFTWIAKTVNDGEITFVEIGAWLGNRDHATIGYLYRTVAPRLRRHDARFRDLCDQFTPTKEAA
ncbi:MAG: hypothetical protein WBA68_10145 [Alteraurantiacibacter sp.]